MKIADKVDARPGSVAWSPDGKRLAFITGGTVHIHDIMTGTVRTLGPARAVAVIWTRMGEIFVIVQDGDRQYLTAIDPAGGEIIRMAVEDNVIALYRGSDRRHMLLLSVQGRRFSYGIETRLRIRSLDRETGATKELYSFNRLHPADETYQRAMLAWAHAGESPLDGSLLIIEHINPPAAAPYSRVITLDTVSTDVMELVDRSREAAILSAGWSPDGSRIALTRRDGMLEIRDARTGRIIRSRAAPGYIPAWSPRGSRIYAGGSLLDPDGSAAEAVLVNAPWSVAAWSPEGAALAVADGSALWLLRDAEPANMPVPDADHAVRTKMRHLQELYREDLITHQEYQARKRAILK